MNSQDLVRPIRSLQRFRLEESGLPPGGMSAVGLFRAILQAGGGDTRHCAANVVVYGDQTPAAEEFAAATLACLGPLDSLWRVGIGRASDPRVIWVDEGERLLTMLTARVLFISSDEHSKGVAAEWQGRADAVFVGPGPRADDVEIFFSASLASVWGWGTEFVWIDL